MAKSSPQIIQFHGKYCHLEPLNDLRHGADLWSNIQDHPEIWDYMMDGPFADENQFRTWLKNRESHKSRTYYSIISNNSVLGAFCLMDADLTHSTIEIGGIFFSPKLQKTRIATEAIFLLMNHAFDLGFRRLQWKCNQKNEASKKAAERFGFKFEGVLRQHMILKGQNRDTAFFSILDHEWPTIKSGFENWLDDKNFDELGIQKTKLSFK